MRGSGGTGSDDTASGSGNDSSVRQSGRSNFFFGAEYSTLKERNASHAQPGRGDKNPSGLPAGGVDSKTAALVGAACSPGDVAFHLQKLRGLTLKGKGDKQATLHDTKVKYILLSGCSCRFLFVVLYSSTESFVYAVISACVCKGQLKLNL